MSLGTIVGVKASRSEEWPIYVKILHLITWQPMNQRSRATDNQGAVDTLATLTKKADIAVPSNPDLNEAHSEDSVVGEMLQLHDTNRFRAVWWTARATVCTAR